ncbi:MAG: anaerobic ribonucleoside-triphosphate reductase activating protein [Bacteroidaceae bacterium]|nr:anaerobic ribonucleoside-triphosphate reductase activating protein [Bacteroidaceae bacterium]
MLRILSIIEDTMVDGPGFRTSIYCAGCRHNCPGCHNRQSWDFNQGQLMTTDEIMDVILADPFANVTFSGGDPMFQAEGFTELAHAIHKRSNKTIWCFTGFTFEALLAKPEQRRLLEQIDVLVDGPYIERLKDTDLLYRGSSNQRLIDVKESLKQGKVVLYHDPLSLAS